MSKPTTRTTKHGADSMEAHRAYMKMARGEEGAAGSSGGAYRDFYGILGVERYATHDEIRKKYKGLALRYHPDRNASKEAEARWEDVPRAYATLSRPNARAEYDASLPLRDALVVFYQTHNPSKLNSTTIDTIMEGWTGRESDLFKMLQEKYEVASYSGFMREKAAVEALSDDDVTRIQNDGLESDGHGRVGKRRHQVMSSSTLSSVLSVLGHLCCFQSTRNRPYYGVHVQTPRLSDTIPEASHTPSQTPVSIQIPIELSRQGRVEERLQMNEFLGQAELSHHHILKTLNSDSLKDHEIKKIYNSADLHAAIQTPNSPTFASAV